MLFSYILSFFQIMLLDLKKAIISNYFFLLYEVIKENNQWREIRKFQVVSIFFVKREDEMRNNILLWMKHFFLFWAKCNFCHLFFLFKLNNKLFEPKQ